MSIQVLDKKQDEILQNVLFQKSIISKKTDSKLLHRFLVRIANRELTLDDWKFAEENFDKKIIINHVCNCSLGIYLELKKAMNDKEAEAEMIRRGEHPLFVTSDDAKFFHSNAHHPILEINADSVGTPTHLVFHKIRNSNSFKGFTLEELRAYLLVEYHVNPPLHVLKHELSKINAALLLDFESIMKTYDNESDIESLALKRAKELSTKHDLDYAESNQLALEIKKKAKNAERSLARKIAESTFETFIGSMVETHALLKRK